MVTFSVFWIVVPNGACTLEWLTNWFEGFVGWFALLVQGFVSWLLSFLQDSWPAVADTFRIVVQNPETIAIGLGAIVLVMAIGLILGSYVMRSRNENATDDHGYEDELDSEFYDLSGDADDDMSAEKDEMFRR